MPNQEDEIKRYQRIRDQQLAAARPSAKRDRYFKEYRKSHSNHKPTTLKDIIGVFDHKWRGLVIGLILGLIIWQVLLPMLTDAPWRNWAGLIVMILLGGLGMFFGASFDWRDDLRKF
jgi:hypothetical protein